MNTQDNQSPFAGHTPGPWKQHDGFIVARFGFDGEVYDVCDPRCAPADDADSIAEMEANARLIAAAPALLASHAALVAALEKCLYSADSIFSPRLEPVEQIKTVARAALSTARQLTQGGGK